MAQRHRRTVYVSRRGQVSAVNHTWLIITHLRAMLVVHLTRVFTVSAPPRPSIFTRLRLAASVSQVSDGVKRVRAESQPSTSLL